MTYPASAPLASIVPCDPASALDAKAAVFAKRHGSSALCFDASQNDASPDYRPWTLVLDGGECRSRGGFAATDAIEFASAELDTDA